MRRSGCTAVNKASVSLPPNARSLPAIFDLFKILAESGKYSDERHQPWAGVCRGDARATRAHGYQRQPRGLNGSWRRPSAIGGGDGKLVSIRNA